jgi:predicted nucleotide-binding protein
MTVANPNERIASVMNALNDPKHESRTVIGISKEAHLNEEETRQILTDLENSDVVVRLRSRDGTRELFITRERFNQRSTGAAATPSPAPPPQSERQNTVFVVHGHDQGSVAVVRRILERQNFEVKVLQTLPSRGRTIITKFREEAAGVGFAVVVMTPDDLGKAKDAADLNRRARQNVVFEHGFFIGALGAERVAALVKGDIERPSDLDGVLYISLDKENWKEKLGRELEAVGYQVDWRTLME